LLEITKCDDSSDFAQFLQAYKNVSDAFAEIIVCYFIIKCVCIWSLFT